MPKHLWRAVFVIVLVTIVVRAASLVARYDIDDEAIYSVVANEIVDGGRPYADATDSKPPLLFWTYAAVFKLTGKYNWFALHAGALVWTLATMAALYLIGRRLFDVQTGLVAALLYGIFHSWGPDKTLCFDGELLMNLPIAWAYAIALRPRNSTAQPALLVSGGLLAVAFLLKQPAAIAAVPLGIYFLLPAYRDRRELPKAIGRAALFASAFCITLGIFSVILWKQGILSEAFYWTVSEHTIRHMFWDRAAVNTAAFVACCLPLILGAIFSLRRKYGIWGQSPERTALVLLLFVSIIGVMAGSRFFPHYYIQLILPFAILAAPFYSRLWSDEIVVGKWFRPSVTYIWLGVTVFAFFIVSLSRATLKPEPREAARYILEHSAPTDRIFVWGQHPGLYLESQRRPACRYVTTYFLTGYLFGHDVPGLDHRTLIQDWAWKDLENDFARHPPAYIIDTEVTPNALSPIKDFPALAVLLKVQYQQIARLHDAVIYRRRSDSF